MEAAHEMFEVSVSSMGYFPSGSELSNLCLNPVKVQESATSDATSMEIVSVSDFESGTFEFPKNEKPTQILVTVFGPESISIQFSTPQKM